MRTTIATTQKIKRPIASPMKLSISRNPSRNEFFIYHLMLLVLYQEQKGQRMHDKETASANEAEPREVIILEGPLKGHRGKVVGSYTSPEGFVLLTIEPQGGTRLSILESNTRPVEES
jgi:hypothetical protein